MFSISIIGSTVIETLILNLWRLATITKHGKGDGSKSRQKIWSAALNVIDSQHWQLLLWSQPQILSCQCFWDGGGVMWCGQCMATIYNYPGLYPHSAEGTPVSLPSESTEFWLKRMLPLSLKINGCPQKWPLDKFLLDIILNSLRSCL